MSASDLKRGLSRRHVLAGLGAGLSALPFTGLRAQTPAATDRPNFRRFKTLQRGLNLSLWFEWLPPDRQGMIQRIDGKYQSRDLAQIRDMGFDHVRVSIQPDFLAPGLLSGDATLNPERMKWFDGAMQRITQQKMGLVLDNHTTSAMKDKMAADRSYWPVMGQWWKNFAKYVAGQQQYDIERTFLEMMNEPEQSWNDNDKYREMMGGLIADVRSVVPNHTLIVGGNMWNVPEALLYNLKTPFDDNNIIYTFHYYEPKSFTTQGVAAAGDFYGKLKNVPWGHPPKTLSATELAAYDPAVRDSMKSYAEKGQGKAAMQPVFAGVRQWCQTFNQVAWIGEFGVHYPVAPVEDRRAWVRAVRELANENGFGWCMWEARGGFGLFLPGDTRPLPVDKPLLAALGL